MAEVWIDGERYEIPEKKEKPADSRSKAVAAAGGERAFPGRENGPLAQPRTVIVRGATVWTQGPGGILENADVLAVDGKIVAVGKSLTAPSGAVEVDGRGKHVTPGIIDAHSHTSIDGPVNEGTNAVTAEVRVRDVLDPFDVAIYRELAGGTTTANVLHGSANAIGGQNAIVKWRWGSGPTDLLVAGAPEGIKFALGREPETVQLAERKAAVSRNPDGRRQPDPRAVPRRAGLPPAPGGVPEGRGGQGVEPRAAPQGPAARGDRGNPGGEAPDPLPLLPQGRDPRDDPRRRGVRREDRDVPARARRLQGRRRDGPARSGRLDVLGLVGLQGGGLRRDPLQRRPDARAGRGRFLQFRFRRARAPPELGRQPRPSATAAWRRQTLSPS